MPPAVTSILEPHVERPVGYTHCTSGLNFLHVWAALYVRSWILLQLMRLCGIFPHTLKDVGFFIEKKKSTLPVELLSLTPGMALILWFYYLWIQNFSFCNRNWWKSAIRFFHKVIKQMKTSCQDSSDYPGMICNCNSDTARLFGLHWCAVASL